MKTDRAIGLPAPVSGEQVQEVMSMATATKKRNAAKVKKRVEKKKKLYDAAEHMEHSREKFVAELLSVIGEMDSFSGRLRTFGAVLDKREDTMRARFEVTHTVMDSLERLADVLTANTMALHQNTERLDGFIRKVESYFGSGEGLDHEN
jgi:galactokinase